MEGCGLSDRRWSTAGRPLLCLMEVGGDGDREPSELWSSLLSAESVTK